MDLTALNGRRGGKGSHATLYFGDRLTIVRNPKDELKTGWASRPADCTADLLAQRTGQYEVLYRGLYGP